MGVTPIENKNKIHRKENFYMEKSTREWKRINIAIEQIELIKKLMNNPIIKAKYNFQSIPEVIRRAVSEFIEKLQKEIEEQTGMKPF